MNQFLVLALLVSCLITSGCGAIPKLNLNATFNEPVQSPIYKETKAGVSGPATIAETHEHPFADKRVFVGVAISGGGTRAANFGGAVLYELERQGILAHVSAISSVSGGSVANAYFSLHGAVSLDEIASSGKKLGEYREPFWTSFREALATDFRSDWTRRYLNPLNILSTSITHKDRTDILAETFDDTLFRNKTFGDLPKFGVLSPRMLINATALNEPRVSLPSQITRNEYGYTGPLSGFTFTDESFFAIRSRLDTFAISRAVAASAAFPGVFNASTLRTFARKEGSGSKYIEDDYLHLIDGGPSDNLGTDALLGIVRKFHNSSQPGPTNSAPSACLLIVVDASANQTGDVQLRKSPDPRGFVSHFIDLDFMDASDALLQRRREDTLQELGVPHAKFGERGFNSFFSVVPGYLSRMVHLSKRFNPSVGFPTIARSTSNSGASFINTVADGFLTAGVGTTGSKEIRCAVWRISIDDVVSAGAPWIESKSMEDSKDSAAIKHSDSPEARTRRRVWEVVSRIKTDFDLIGPRGCTKADLQNAIWDAARIAVRDDFSSRAQVCSWMKSNGILPFVTCATAPDKPLVWPIDSEAPGSSAEPALTKYEVDDPVPPQYCHRSRAQKG